VELSFFRVAQTPFLGQNHVFTMTTIIYWNVQTPVWAKLLLPSLWSRRFSGSRKRRSWAKLLYYVYGEVVDFWD
jgi:hypothetical protein